MIDESAKQAAQEYLAAKLSEEEQIYEDTQNRALALARSPMVWKYFRDTIFEKCREWNAITGEETLVCKENRAGRPAHLVRGAKATDDGVLRFPETSDYGEKRPRGWSTKKGRDPTHGRIPDGSGANEPGCAPGEERAGR